MEETIYFTQYEYYNSAFHNLDIVMCPILIVVPKLELDNMSTDELKIIFYDVERCIKNEE